MKLIHFSGILLLMCISVTTGDYRKDCLVDDLKMVENWAGEEITFHAFVLENDVVNIQLTYEFLDVAKFLTTIYISPNISHSKIIETKDEKDYRSELDPMEKSNNWFQFKISSSHTGSINLKYEPDIHEIIHINQPNPTIKDLKIRASNISFCEERNWEVNDGSHVTIPLGEDLDKMLFTLIFQHSNDVEAYLHFSKHVLHLQLNEYNLEVDLFMSPIQIEGSDIKLNASENVTTIDISSKGGQLNILMSIGERLTTLPSTTFESDHNDENGRCSPHADSFCYPTLITLLIVFIICTIFIGILFKLNILKMKIPWNRNDKNPRPNGDIETDGNNSDNQEMRALTT